LTAIIDTFAYGVSERTLPTDDDDVRVLVAAGVVVPFLVICAREVARDTVELLWLDFAQ